MRGRNRLFDLEKFIIYRCVVGSRAYGLDNDESDTDRRGIYLAPADLQWSLFGAPEQFEDNATQSCYWELQKFLTMALKANPNILECLYSPMVEKATPLGEELLAIREAFLSQMIFQTFNGYAMSQFKKIEQFRAKSADAEVRRGRRRAAQSSGSAPRWNSLETRHAPAAPAAHRRGHVARSPRPCPRRGPPRPLARRQTRRTAVDRSGRLAQGTAPRLRTRPGPNQTARTPRLRSGESLPHQSAAGNGRLHRIVAAQPYPLLFATISGAHLYGFPSPDSDFDLRGAHVLPLEAVVGLEVRDETVEQMIVPRRRPPSPQKGYCAEGRGDGHREP
jgi:predicted nucleotidyltransferase